MNSQNISAPKEKILKIWFGFNLILFILSHFGPWGTVFGDIYFGYTVAQIAFDSISTLSISFFSVIAIPWVCFTGYLIVSIVNIFHPTKLTASLKEIFIILSLAASIFWTSAMLLFDNFNRFWWPRVSWGYWIFLLSVASSTIIEIISTFTIPRVSLKEFFS